MSGRRYYIRSSRTGRVFEVEASSARAAVLSFGRQIARGVARAGSTLPASARHIGPCESVARVRGADMFGWDLWAGAEPGSGRSARAQTAR